MGGNHLTDLHNFFIVGINYKKSDTLLRGRFAVSTDQYESILQIAPQKNLAELFVISTCNRTEVYGITNSAEELMEVLCSVTTGSIEELKKAAYIKKGFDAVQHLFFVTAGLDSQILGDYEIVGQMKTAIRFAKERGFIGSHLERITNSALQSSKEIKTTTELSGGTISVSFAAIQYLSNTIKDISNKKILVVGIGKIGGNTCKNIVDYLQTTNVTLVNRSDEKAAALAKELNLKYVPFIELQQQIKSADIILVSTHATTPILTKQHLAGLEDKILIDLSIPNNVDPEAATLPNVTLINVDDLSKLKDETLNKRKAEVPKAKSIITHHITELKAWYKMRSHVPVLKAVKTKLINMHDCELFTTASTIENKEHNPEHVQKVINVMATKLRQQNTKGCQYIEAINDYITVSNNS
ncbi:glutamyl-tRNA reductase [Ferruginibacter sp. SUN002]|uniref:glutamyl-tRNA reductase n=1 Tax=Ferruginibacter sp. SUN002 TaxID=2937789 RepID=UPI003D35D451